MEMTPKEFWQQCVLAQLSTTCDNFSRRLVVGTGSNVLPPPSQAKRIADVATQLMEQYRETFDSMNKEASELTDGEKIDIQNNRKIIAIKSLRNRILGLSLAEAKKICDQYQNQHQIETKDNWRGPIG